MLLIVQLKAEGRKEREKAEDRRFGLRLLNNRKDLNEPMKDEERRTKNQDRKPRIESKRGEVMTRKVQLM